MGRKNIKCDTETYNALNKEKPAGETWDEYLRRLAQLERATRVE
jgi:predicted CopG family antitoxin